jgi:hypothetical protein
MQKYKVKKEKIIVALKPPHRVYLFKKNKIQRFVLRNSIKNRTLNIYFNVSCALQPIRTFIDVMYNACIVITFRMILLNTLLHLEPCDVTYKCYIFYYLSRKVMYTCKISN